MLRDFPARIGRAAGALAIAVAASAVLPACGVKGPLKPPSAPTTAPGARPADAPATPNQESPATRAPSSPLEPGPQPPSTAP